MEAGADIIETNTFNANALSSWPTTAWRSSATRSTARARASRERWRRRSSRRRKRPGSWRRAGPHKPKRIHLPGRQRSGARNVDFDQLVERLLDHLRRPACSRAAWTSCSWSRPSSTRSTAKAALLRHRGIAVRDQGGVGADHDLRHHHRRQRPHPVRADHRGLLELGAPTPSPWPIGLNCALGADLRPYVQELSGSPTPMSPRTPMPGCPTSSASTTRPGRGDGRAIIAEFAEAGLPQHRRRLLRHHPASHPGDLARLWSPSRPPVRLGASSLPSQRPGAADDQAPDLFVNVGERTNVTGSARFRKLIKGGDYETALERGAPAGGERRADHRHQHGRGHARLRSRP